MAIFNTVPPLQAGAGIKFDGETISTGAAPRNLLDNSDFRNPVNQRGQTSYEGNGGLVYAIDRWFTYSAYMTVSVQDGYLSITNNSENEYAQFSQIVSGLNVIGKTVTVAAWDTNGRISCLSGVMSEDWILSVGNDYNIICHTTENNCIIFSIAPKAYKTANILGVALYEGTYTAETLPEYNPKGYGAELAECQRYYREYDAITLVPWVYEGTSQRHYRLNFDTPMRVAPTVDVSQLLEKQLWSTLSSSFNAYRTDMHGIVFSAISDIVSQSNCYVDGKLSISADL